MNYRKEAKKKYILFTLAAWLLIGAAVAVFAQTTGDNQGYRTISVVEVSGRVSVVKNGIEYEAYPGMLLQEGHEIATSGNSYVRLVLDDDKYIKIESGSRAVFETLGLLGSGKTKIVLERGAMTNELVNPLGPDEEYVVNTPNAVLAVRGTFFRIDLTTSKSGDVRADVKTYGGQVASQRVKPNGEIINEEVLINAGYQTTINMTSVETHYIVETNEGESVIVEPETSGVVSDSAEPLLPTRPINVEELSDDDLVDVYFAKENGHDLFITAEEAKDHIEKRDINLEEKTSVYKKAEEVKAQQEAETAGKSATTANTTNANVIANDSQPLAMVEVLDETTENVVAKEEPPQTSRVLTDGDGESQTNIPMESEDSQLAEVPEEDETETIVSNNTQSTNPPSGNNSSVGVVVVPTTPPVVEEEPHTHTQVTTTTNATCDAEGKTIVSCSECGEVLSETTIAKLEHIYTVTYTDGTATAEGSIREHCRLCDETVSVVELLSIPLHFPDEVFAQYIRDNFDSDGYNSLSQEELLNLKNATTIDVAGTASVDGGIASLEGIEYFTSLNTLNCDYNANLKTLDLSENTGITTLAMANCSGIEEFDLTGCSNISSIDIPVSGNIRKLYVADTAITELNATALAFLEELDVTNVPLTYLQVNSEFIDEIDISTNTQLEYIDVAGCRQLASLDISGCTELETLNVSGCTSLTTMPMYGCEKLLSLDCSNSGITSLYLEYNAMLTELDASNCTNLTGITMYAGGAADTDRRLATLDITGCTRLGSLNVERCSLLTDLDISTCTGLAYLDMTQSGITSLDVSNNSKLWYLKVVGTTGLTSIDFSQTPNSELSMLYINESGVTDLNIAGCRDLNSNSLYLNDKLETLNISMCPGITELSLSEFASTLKSLNCSNTGIYTLDTGLCTNLESLNVSNTGISYLSTSNCSKLKELNCSGTNVSTIDVAHANELTSLYVDNTPITSLDLGGKTTLVNFSGAGSQVSSLNITGTGITSFDAKGMQNLTNLTARNSALISLDASGTMDYPNATLETLDITGSSILTTLNVDYCDKLATINASDSGITAFKGRGTLSLTSLDVTNCNNLQTFELYNGHMDSIDFSGCEQMKTLHLENLYMSTIQVQNIPVLQSIEIYYCYSLQSLFIDDNVSLINLDLQSVGMLETISAQRCTSLEQLNVSSCYALTSLDVTDCTNLGYINTGGRSEPEYGLTIDGAPDDCTIE